MKTVALYTRVSTLHQAEEGYSIDEQESRLKLFAQAHRWIITDIYSDPGYSGGKLDRPGIQRLIRDARAHKFDAVLVYKLDRLSRSQKDTLYLIEDVLNPNDIGLVSMCENFDTQTPFGKAMIGILSVFAQLERGQITERMTMGRIGRAKAGYFAGGSRAPIGYTYAKSDGNERNTLVVDAYEAMQIREIYRLFLDEDYSFKQIQQYMHERYTTRYGDWSYVSTVSEILHDRVYIGEVSFSQKWYPGVHQPIIDRATFESAQEKYDRYMSTAAGRLADNFRGSHLLTGLLRCGICGEHYFLKTYRHIHKDSSIHYTRKYMCYTASGNVKSRTAGKNCNNISIPMDELESSIISELRKLAVNPDLIYSLANQSSPSASNPEEDKAALKKRLNDLAGQEEKLIDLYQIGAVDLEMVRKRAAAIKSEQDKIHSLLEKQEKKTTPSISVGEAISQIERFEEVISTGTIDEKRALIRSLIDEVVIYPERIEIHWTFVSK